MLVSQSHVFLKVSVLPQECSESWSKQIFLTVLNILILYFLGALVKQQCFDYYKVNIVPIPPQRPIKKQK